MVLNCWILKLECRREKECARNYLKVAFFLFALKLNRFRIFLLRKHTHTHTHRWWTIVQNCSKPTKLLKKKIFHMVVVEPKIHVMRNPFGVGNFSKKKMDDHLTINRFVGWDSKNTNKPKKFKLKQFMNKYSPR